MKAKIVIGMLSTPKLQRRIDVCQATWLADAREAGVEFVLITSTSESAIHRERETLWVPGIDEAGRLTEKTRGFCRWADSIDNWDYLLKVDDNTFVSIPRLLEYDLAGRDYVGHALWGDWALGGSGFFLSRRAAAIVAEKLTMVANGEDYCVGDVLRQAGIKFHHEARMIPDGSHELAPRRHNAIFTTHNINEEIWQICQDEAGLRPRPLPASKRRLDRRTLRAARRRRVGR